MGSYTVECSFELCFQPAMKLSPERITEIVATELDIDKVRITTMSVEHDIPTVEGDAYMSVMIENGETIVSGTYERPVRY